MQIVERKKMYYDNSEIIRAAAVKKKCQRLGSTYQCCEKLMVNAVNLWNSLPQDVMTVIS